MTRFDDAFDHPPAWGKVPSLEVAVGGTDTEWGLAALRSECAIVGAATNGVRDDTFNRAAFRIGQLIGGGQLTVRTALAELIPAARRTRQPERDILRAFRLNDTGGLIAGQQQPRRPEPRPPLGNVTPLPHVSPAPVETVDLATGEVLEHRAPRSSMIRSVDMAEVVRGVVDGTTTRPRTTIGWISDDVALFYPGRVNGVAGQSTDGKTWTALITAKQEIDAGNTVVYFDLEDTAEAIVSRLINDLGADPATVAGRFVWKSLDGPFRQIEGDEVAALIADRRPTLVVIDSTGEAAALEGIEAAADEKWAIWFRRFPRQIADLGPAVLLLDHLPKNGESLDPIGSQRKKAAINGAQYVQVMPKGREFAKDRDGYAELECRKDRHGNYHKGQKVARLDGGPSGFELRPHVNAGTFRPTHLMERISGFLAANPGATMSGICAGVPGFRKQTKIEAVELLRLEGFVRRSTEGQAKRHELIRPFTEAESAGGEA